MGGWVIYWVGHKQFELENINQNNVYADWVFGFICCLK